MVQIDDILLSQAYDNIQCLMLGYKHNFFDKTGNIKQISYFHKLCKEYKINPLWGMAICFDRFQFLNRKRKKLPVMLPGQLNRKQLVLAINSKIKYDKKRISQEIKTYPYLNSIFLIALNCYFECGYDKLAQEVKKQYHHLIKDFQTQPYTNSTKESLRKALLSNNNNIWKNIFLLDGVSSMYVPLFLFSKEVANEYLAIPRNEFTFYYCGILSKNIAPLREYESIEYLAKGIQYCNEEGLLV